MRKFILIVCFSLIATSAEAGWLRSRRGACVSSNACCRPVASVVSTTAKTVVAPVVSTVHVVGNTYENVRERHLDRVEGRIENRIEKVNQRQDCPTGTCPLR